MDKQSFLRGKLAQDHLLAKIEEIWSKTDDESKEMIIDIILSDLDVFKECLSKFPDHWVVFIKYCMLYTIRESLLCQK